MNIEEYLRQSMRSIGANKLRSWITIATLAVGITCLVGMMTAIEALKASAERTFSELGAHSFSIRSKDNRRNRRFGIVEKFAPPLRYFELMRFKQAYSPEYGLLSVLCDISGSAVVQRATKKTHANVDFLGVDENALKALGYDLSYGRNFTLHEVKGGQSVAILGDEVYQRLFGEGAQAIGAHVIVRGARYMVVGKLAQRGASEEGYDRMIAIPLGAARRQTATLRYRADVRIEDPSKAEEAVEVARHLMRRIRRDPYTQTDSFEIREMKATQNNLNKQLALMRITGYVLGLITLLGASVGLMNIMFVYVQERTREIGLRKALGATAAEIRTQFLIEAISLCQIGGIAGIGMGMLMGNVVALMTQTHFVFPWKMAIIGLCMSLFAGILAGYLPAKFAASVDPIQSLRHE